MNRFWLIVIALGVASTAYAQKKVKMAKPAEAASAAKAIVAKPQSEVVSEQPLNSSEPIEIVLPESLRSEGTKVRIKNLTTGKQVIVDIIGASTKVPADKLVDSTSKLIVPEFSVLAVSKKTKNKAYLRDEKASAGGYRLNRSLIYDQAVWRPLGYRSRDAAGGKKLFLGFGLKTKIISAEEASMRRQLKESSSLKKLFDTAWGHLKAKRYDLALKSFDELLKNRAALNKDQLSQGHLGRAISKFHQQGCQESQEDFSYADQDPRNYDDVSYYRALCFVEEEKWKDAKPLFEEQVRKQNPSYVEQSRFYLGVVAENQEKWDEAEGIYLDTIDFSSDQNLIDLARARLAVVRQMRAEANYEDSWISFILSLGSGYDTNVVGLPSGSTPTDFNVTDEKSFSWMGLGGFQARIPYARTIQQTIDYSFLALHYFNTTVADSYDMQVHDGGTAFTWSQNDKNSWTLDASYNSIYLGEFLSSGEYLTSINGELSWLYLSGRLDSPTAQWENKIKFSKIDQKTTPALSTLDLSAYSYFYSGRYRILTHSPHSYGPGWDLEYRPAVGSDNSYYAATLLGMWDMPIYSPWGLLLSQEAASVNTFYYQHSSDRKDFVLRYTGSISKMWWNTLETRLQVIGTMSFSTVPAQYKYNKAQINFLVSSFF